VSPDPRYQLLAPIGKGGMGEVFRAQDRLTGQWVALKRVHVAHRPTPLPVVEESSWRHSLERAATMVSDALASPIEDPTDLPVMAPTLGSLSKIGQGFTPPGDGKAQALRLHLTQEFRTLASLRHPHIVSVLDYGFDREQQPYFTMELLESAVPIDEAARSQPLSVRIDLLLQVLQALSYLHRRGVIHRDLKPGNILVLLRPSGPHVKLLDFGLAMLSRSLDSKQAQLAGTFGYIAPEVLSGALPSEASDLFAVGVIAYELLLGAHPLATDSTTALIAKWLGPVPIFLEDERLDGALSAVLRRALCQKPAARFACAWEFSQELARAAGLPLPAETAEIRESFLQAATFVARDAELAILRQALDRATVGSGACWIVGGESGVGKSRLLDELRTLALVRGVRVVRGQAVSAGGAAYQIWQGALRPLCLDAVLDDLQAGVLRSVVPDLATLLGRPIPEPPALDPQSAQARLLLIIENLLLSQRQPLVLLLEDLHWAEPASLAVLQRLTRVVARHPLLLLGSYRKDERPTLPDELPGTQTLSLQRFSAAELALLSSSMLGAAGNRPQVVSLLERETEGNNEIEYDASHEDTYVSCG
jgi:serine/threonine protein kinase